jgi:isoleucyl-tRNA synthetase
MALRDRVLKEIETARNEKLIGDSLEARVSLQLDPAWYELAQQEQSLLNLILVVSDIRITAAETESIRIERVTGSKCPRCWNRFPDPSAAEEEKLCSRCQTVTDAMKARV